MQVMISKYMSNIVVRQYENILCLYYVRRRNYWGLYIIKMYGKYIKKNKCMGRVIWEINME